ncbi:MAG: hypothetical protein HYT16_00670 [DPANN group archaeon]|nr:hypothetical protein [DPANN group archaeon]
MATVGLKQELKLVIFSIIILAAAIFLVKFGAEVTGFATSDVTFFRTQGANFVADSNSESTLTLVGFGENSTLTSFKVAGLLSGDDGYARVYLKGDDGTKYLIVSDSYARTHARNSITGFAVNGKGQGNQGQGQGNQGNNGNNGKDNNAGGNGQGNQGQGQGNQGNKGKSGDSEDRGGEQRSWHSTPKKNKAASFYSDVEEKVEQKQQAKKYNFELGCQESCSLPKGALTGRTVTLIFEVSNAELKINNVQYKFVPHQINITNAVENQTNGGENPNNETYGNNTVTPPNNETQTNQTAAGNETTGSQTNQTASNPPEVGVTAQASASGGSPSFSSSGSAAEEKSEGTFSKPAPQTQGQQPNSGSSGSGAGQPETSGSGEGLTGAAAGLISRTPIYGFAGISGYGAISPETNEAVKSWLWVLASIAILFYLIIKNIKK